MASGVDEAAADEHRGGDLVELRELADGVENDDVVARLGVHAQLAAAGDVPAGPAREPLDLVEPLGLARRDDEQRLRHRGADALEGLEHGVFLAFQRAGRDDDGAIGRDPEVAQHAVAARDRRTASPGSSSESNLSEPVTATRSRSAPMSMIAAGRLVALHAEACRRGGSTRRKNGRARR